MMTTPTRIRRGAAWATALAGLLVMAGAPEARQSTQSISGTWIVQVTLRNCQTQAPLGPSFNSLVTFMDDGTILEATEAPAFAPGQRTAAHGRWTRLGPTTFTQRVIAIIGFDTPPTPPTSPGFQRGGSVVTQLVTMTNANAFTSTGGNGFYDANAQLYRSGCSSAVGQRFQ
jgi:hypothetical protein